MSLSNIYIPRIIDEKLDLYLKVFGVVSIEGPKWCGKTMTALQKASSYIMLEESKDIREMVEMQPSVALEGNPPRLIDEWQDVPSLWDMVRYKVDKENQKGLYILTGSTGINPNKVYHSGAGRIAILKEETMTLFETGDSTGEVSLQSLWSGDFKPCIIQSPKLEDLAFFIVRGGWPGNLSTPREASHLLPSQYIEATLGKDLYKVDDRIRDKEKFRLLLKSLARNESTTASMKKINDDISLDGNSLHIETLEDYMNVAKQLYLISDQEPFGFNVRSSVRVKQMKKHHFIDTSLAASLLGIKEQGLMNDLETFGFLFEALCEHDLRIYAEANNAKLYHYQDYKNRELDAVIELEDGRWGAFEIKLGANRIDEAAENLLKIKREIEADPKGKPPVFLAVVSGLAPGAYLRKDGVYVLPLTSLRP